MSILLNCPAAIAKPGPIGWREVLMGRGSVAESADGWAQLTAALA